MQRLLNLILDGEKFVLYKISALFSSVFQCPLTIFGFASTEGEELGQREEVHLARSVLKDLPRCWLYFYCLRHVYYDFSSALSTNKFKSSSHLFSGLNEDGGFYDLLLHKYGESVSQTTLSVFKPRFLFLNHSFCFANHSSCN